MKWPHLVDKQSPNRFARKLLHVFITVSEVVVAVLIAVFVEDLGATYELVGLSAMCLSLVLPTFCYIKLEWAEMPWTKAVCCVAVAVIGVGSCIALVVSMFLFPSGPDSGKK